MPQPLDELRSLLRQARRVLVIAHVSPDGDTIGSTLGLAAGLRHLGLAVRLAGADPVPANLRFLPGTRRFSRRPVGHEDLIIAVDCSDASRTGGLHESAGPAAPPLVVLDHHITNSGWGQVNIIDPDAAATAQVVLRVVQHLGVPLDPDMATCLLTGVVTDTLGFRTNNTTPQVLQDAVTLMAAGAPLALIMDEVYGHNPLPMMRLWGLAFSRAVLQDGVLWVELSQQDMAACSANVTHVSGLANFMSTIDEAEVALVLREMGDGRIDVSLRSRPRVDVAQVAAALGGGGHPQASGCQLTGTLTESRERVLATLRQQMVQPVQ